MTNPEFKDLEPGEEVVPDESKPSELLWRQICDHSLDNGKPGMDSFGPQKADKRRPSFSRSSLVTAQESRDWHNNNAQSRSQGVWACSVEEIITAGTRAIDDSQTPLEADEVRAPGHAFVDYRHYGKGGLKTVKGLLLKAALAREEIATVDNPPAQGGS
ncbi:hypothetical protein RQCS_11760 [Rhodococcus qingshengii]|uniref:hypothetical protein n=1 Tax=Rhodococcus qingshengii TaxID=334542 RepID=UPI0007E5AFB9|nr:hypothetical protein [Rhodococcus qingshengii]BCF81631.1 hypothetical protein RQCS_11760 [Rhodococcus qingshengii]